MSDDSQVPRSTASAPRREAEPPRTVGAVQFPPSITDGDGPNWRRRSVTASAVVIALALVGGVGVARASSSSSVDHRTATVATQDVESVLTSVGSVEPVNQASVSFPVAGTVASVDVTVGQTVDAAQQLATLDPQALDSAVDQKQAALATAQLTLSKALTSTSSTSASTTSAASTSTGSGTGGRSGSGSGSGSGSEPLTAALDGVVNGQKALDRSLAAADEALAQADKACTATPTPPPTSPASTPSTPPETTPPTTGDGSTTQACLTALQAVSTAQHQVAADAEALATAAATYDQLAQQQASTGASSSSPSTTAPSTTASSGVSRTGSGGGSGAGSGTPASSADLIADQKAVDAAAAALDVARQDLAAATIASPIPGSVVAVNLTVGQSVSAGSTTANVILAGPGGMEVTTSIGVDRIADVKIGQPAKVLADGSTDALPGKVATISATPTTSTRSTSYLVTIALDDPAAPLFNGATAQVRITTGTVRSALAVPTSAVVNQNGAHTVQVLDGVTASRVNVTIGVVGSTWTEVTEGLTVGQVVIVADPSAPLPDSATATAQSTTRSTASPVPGGFTPGQGFGGGARPPG